MNITYKESLQDYTEQEFLEFIDLLFQDYPDLEGDDYDSLIDEIILNLKRLSEHPSGADLVYYPGEGKEGTPQEILQEIKEWRAANGKPGFLID